METIKVDIINQNALTILKGMEQAGLIALQKKDISNENLVEKLKGSIKTSRAKEMMEAIERERKEWEERY